MKTSDSNPSSAAPLDVAPCWEPDLSAALRRLVGLLVAVVVVVLAALLVLVLALVLAGVGDAPF